MKFKLFGKKYRIREFSIAWWTAVVMGIALIIGGTYSWYLLFYLVY